MGFALSEESEAFSALKSVKLLMRNAAKYVAHYYLSHELSVNSAMLALATMSFLLYSCLARVNETIIKAKPFEMILRYRRWTSHHFAGSNYRGYCVLGWRPGKAFCL